MHFATGSAHRRGSRGVSVSVHHAPGSEWMALTSAVIDACKAVASEYVEAGELEPPADVEWLVNGAGAFEIGGPEGDNGLSGKKLVAQAYGTAVPIGGGAVFGKDPLKVDPVATVLDGCVGCGLCGENAHAATLCPSFYRGETIVNAGFVERIVDRVRRTVIGALQPA